MLGSLVSIGRGGYYWSALFLVGISFMAVALYYQFVKGDLPCVLCIQVRLWMVALIIVSLAVLGLRKLKYTTGTGHLLTLVIAVGLLERSYQLLGTERGFGVGECGFDLGLPSWFTPDQWVPDLFQVETTCGYTPELLFGITMAEALIVFSAVFVLVGAFMFITSFRHSR